jgi:WD40-like Beta Propeller Repeat
MKACTAWNRFWGCARRGAALVGVASCVALVSGYGDAARRGHAAVGLLAFARGFTTNFQIWTIHSDGSGERHLTNGPFYADDPAWSPTGKQIVFSRLGVATPTLFVMNADGRKQRKLLPPRVSLAVFPAWAPRGDRIAFNGTVFTRTGIYSIGANGRGVKPIRTVLVSSVQGWVAVSFSPNGGTIAFTRSVFHRDTGKAYFELWLAKPNGSRARKLAGLGSTYANLAPGDPNPTSAWSPDGKRLAVSVYTSPTERDIYVINRDGSSFKNLTQAAGDDLRPSWSPDGKQVAFTSDRDGNFELYVMNADGSSQTRITNNSVPDLAPAWQPVPK